MDVEIVKISSKGQFVFPLSMRKKFKMGKGEKMMLVENNGTVIMRPIKGMGDDLDEEMYMMHKAALGWDEIARGDFKRMPKAKFLKELETW
jgi:AbrB family looped-hinge helix DNA binding protein